LSQSMMPQYGHFILESHKIKTTSSTITIVAHDIQ
jgi:hypothetical protein